MAHHHQRDLINKDDAAERLKIPVHAPSAAAVGSLPSPLSLPPPAVTPAPCSPPPASSSSAVVSPRNIDTAPAVLQLSSPAAADPAPSPAPAASFAAGVPARCTSCRKRVGLAGFRCRCGDLFCGVHRYSDRHACTFDYKAQAREAIARDNPVHKAAKLLKI